MYAALPDWTIHQALQSLKEFYEDQRSRYASPTELEMRVYHRLIHIRDQKERHEDIPESITSHPVFKLTTQFRLHVQQKSAPISKTSRLIVAEEGMQIFGQLVTVLSEQGNRVMVYLVACLLERLFGTDTIDDIEGIRADLSISDIIDGATSHGEIREVGEVDDEDVELDDELDVDDYVEGDDEEYKNAEAEYVAPQLTAPVPLKPSDTFTQPPSALPTTSSVFPTLPKSAPVVAGAFAGLVSSPNVFGTQSAFGTSIFPPVASNSSQTTFGTPNAAPKQSVFGLAPSPVAAPSLNQTPSQPQPSPPVQLSEKPPSSFFKLAAPSTSPSNIFGMFLNWLYITLFNYSFQAQNPQLHILQRLCPWIMGHPPRHLDCPLHRPLPTKFLTTQTQRHLHFPLPGHHPHHLL